MTINEARQILGAKYRTEAETIRTITENLLTDDVQQLMQVIRGSLPNGACVRDLVTGHYGLAQLSQVEQVFTHWNRMLGVVRFTVIGDGLGMPFVEPLLHMRLDGRSAECPLVACDLTILSSDDEIRAAVARHYDINADHMVIVRERLGIIVRPPAVYG